MPTIVETLTQLGQDLRDAIASVLGLRSDVQAIKDSTVSSTTTIINNFLGRPPTVLVWFDPDNGNDAFDGTTPAKAKKTLDAIIGSMGTNATDIRMLGNGELKRRYPIYAPLSITGVQLNGSFVGYQFARRTLSFAGPALNSPQDILGNFPAGFEMFGPSLRTIYVDFNLPVTPSGYEIRDHFGVRAGANISLQEFTLTVQGIGAGALIGGAAARATVFALPTFGANAAGHLFLGTAAGANPNAMWNFDTNVLSA